MSLLLKIARCPNAIKCIGGGNGSHPCSTIVSSQPVASPDDFQVPEPWSGHIESAPILFVSSNPAIRWTEDYPRWSWPDDHITDYFANRFGGGRKEWTRDGKAGLQQDGTYARVSHFRSEVNQRARELLQRDPRPGIDYALTEVVHCKSLEELGVKGALGECAALYLRPVIEESGAMAVVVLGHLARRAVKAELGIQSDSKLHGPVEFGGRGRLILFLPHPSAFAARKLEKNLTEAELARVRSFLTPSPQIPVLRKRSSSANPR